MPNTLTYSDFLASTRGQAQGVSPLALYPTTRQDELSQYMPSQEDVMKKKEEQEGGVMSTIFKALELPSILTGAYSIAGGLEAAFKGENVGEAVARGSPFAFISDWMGLSEDLFGEQAVARRKQFRDIRIAAGDQTPDEGWYDTVINVVGSIALDPSTFLLPGGTLRGIERGAKAALVEHGMMWGLSEARGGAAAITGAEEAMKGFNPLRAAAAQNMVSDVRGLVMGAMGQDPRLAISMAEKAKASSMAFIVFNVPFTSIQFPIKLVPATWRNRIAEGLTDAGRVLQSNPVTGALIKAFGGVATGAKDALAVQTLKNAPTIRNNMQRNIVLQVMGGLQNLQQKAREAGVVFDKETDKVLVDFIEHNVAATDDVMDIMAKMNTSGKVLDATMAKNFSGRLKQTLEEGGNFPVPEGVLAGAALPNTREAALREARFQRFDRFNAFFNKLDDPTKLKSYLEYTDGVQELLKLLDVGEQRAGLMHATIEPYFPRVMTPEAKELMDNVLPGLVDQAYGKDGMSILAPFLKNRKITDLSTLEINYIGNAIGFKATGYQPLSTWMGELLQSNKPLWKKLKKADPEMVQWFTTDISSAFYDRVRRSGEVVSKKVMLDYLFHPDNGVAELVKDVGLEEVMRQAPGKVLVERLDSGLGYRQVSQADATKQAFVALDDSRLAGARDGVREEIKLQREALNQDHASVKKMFQDAQDVTIDSPLDFNPGEISLQREKKVILRGIQAQTAEIERLSTKVDVGGKLVVQDPWALDVARKSLKKQQDALLDVGERIRMGIQELNEDYKAVRGDLRTQQTNTLKAIDGTVRKPGETAYEVAAIRASADTQGVRVWDDLSAGLPQNTGKNLYLVDREVADGIRQVLDLTHSKDPFNRLLSWFDQATNWWKRITVLPFPQSRARDMFSNFAMLALGGFQHPSSFADASRVSGAYGKFLKGEFDTVEDAFKSVKVKLGEGASPELAELLQDGHMDGATFFKEARARGLVDSGFLRDEFQNSYVDMYRHARDNSPGATLNAMLNPIKALDLKPGTSFWVKTGSQIAEWGDNFAKISGFADALKRGMSLDEAAAHVRKYIWSPGTTTYSAIEKYGMRRIFPFYNWVKHVTGTMTEQYFKKPGAFSMFQHISEEAKAAVGTTDFNEDVIAANVIHNRLGIPVKMTDKGPVYVMFDGYLPHADVPALMQAFLGIMPFGKVSPKQSLTFLAERMNPIIKDSVENALNYEFYSNRDIEHFDGEASEMFGVPMSKKTRKIISNIRFLDAIDKLNLVNLSDFQIKGGANVRSSKATAEPLPVNPDFSGSLGDFANSLFTTIGPTGPFGPFPKARRVDVEIEAKKSFTAAKRTIGEARSAIKKRIDDPRVSRKMDMDTLKTLIANKQAEMLRINETASKFGVNVQEE